ncbi:MAG: VOC family protein [Chloroflexota bacterium]|jgi:hypothetical protein|nr:VOC family protein [Chloroflexota bacterium]MDP6509499.1 VOC family protein [Chloroflexota bacterium]MDP6757223.1 VOC family protein [Chloroflexota bacterium]
MDRVVHFEISAAEPEALVGFYENVFGWKVNKWDGPEDYWLASTGEEGTPGIDGAFMRPADGTPRTVVTVEVEDLDSTVAKAKENGGRVAMEKMAVPMIGWAAYLVDPQGTVVGLMQPDEKAGM